MTIVKKEIVEYDRRKSSVQLTCAEKRNPFKLSQQKTTAACGDRNKFFIVRLHFYVIVNRESTLQLTTMQRGKQIKRSYVVTRLGEIQHTALGNPLTKQRTRPDHRLTTRDVRSLLHSHSTSLLWKKRPRTPIFVTTSLCTLPIINIRCFILYSTHGTEDVAQMKNVQDETGGQWFRITNVDISGNFLVHATGRLPSEEFVEQRFLQDKVRDNSSRWTTLEIRWLSQHRLCMVVKWIS